MRAKRSVGQGGELRLQGLRARHRTQQIKARTVVDCLKQFGAEVLSIGQQQHRLRSRRQHLVEHLEQVGSGLRDAARGAGKGHRKRLLGVDCFWQLHLAHFGGLFWPPCKRVSKSLISGHLLSFLGTWSGAEPEGRSAGRCPQKRAPSLLPPSLLLRQRPTKAVGLLARLDDVSAVGDAIQQRLT